MLQDQTMEGAVVVMNKRAIERGEEGENKISWEGGPTKLPERGGGQQQRPGKEEPLVGWEEGRNQRPPTQLKPVLGGVHSPSVVAPPG